MYKLYIFLDDFDQDYVKESLLDNSEESVVLFLENLKSILSPFQERKDTIRYNADSVIGFLSFFEKDMKEVYLQELTEKIRDILENGKSQKISTSENHSYFVWDICETSVKSIDKHSILSKIIDFIPQNPNDKFVLVLPTKHNNPYGCRNFITCFRDNIEENESPKFIKIAYVTNETEARQWIKDNRYPLKISKSNKHGENGKGAHKSNKGDEVGILSCSITKAQELLNTAICDKREKEKYYYNFDTEIGKFIIFYHENETPQNQYHAFHLEEADIRKIPNKILKRLKEMYDL